MTDETHEDEESQTLGQSDLSTLLYVIGFKQNEIEIIYRLAKKQNVKPLIFIRQSLALMQRKIEPVEPMDYPGCIITD